MVVCSDGSLTKAGFNWNCGNNESGSPVSVSADCCVCVRPSLSPSLFLCAHRVPADSDMEPHKGDSCISFPELIIVPTSLRNMPQKSRNLYMHHFYTQLVLCSNACDFRVCDFDRVSWTDLVVWYWNLGTYPSPRTND